MFDQEKKGGWCFGEAVARDHESVDAESFHDDLCYMLNVTGGTHTHTLHIQCIINIQILGCTQISWQRQAPTSRGRTQVPCSRARLLIFRPADQNAGGVSSGNTPVKDLNIEALSEQKGNVFL